MSRKGDCWDNAVAESFFATYKSDLIERDVWPTRARAKAATTEYIECFYNYRRSHSSLGYVSPVEYELGAAAVTTAAYATCPPNRNGPIEASASRRMRSPAL